jgi:hypothetical protein
VSTEPEAKNVAAIRRWLAKHRPDVRGQGALTMNTAKQIVDFKPDVYKCDTIKEWIEADGYFAAVDREVEPMATVVGRLTMADLMAAHSEATIALCGPLRDEARERWQEALKAVCEAIGDRFDMLARQANENLPHQIRNLRGHGDDD